MFKSYFIIALRNIKKQGGYAIINIAGLAIGIASFIVIVMYINSELSYDRMHKNADRIYRIVNVYDFGGVGEQSASCPFPVAQSLKEKYPHIVKDAVRFFNFQSPTMLLEYQEKKVSFNERRIFLTDSTIFNVFDFKLISGNEKDALSRPNTIVLTESMVKKYFGSENPIGKTLKFEDRFDLEITGIIADVPFQTHFQFDFLISMITVKSFYNLEPTTWVWNPCWTYLLLHEGKTAAELEKEFPQFIENHFFDAEKDNVKIYLQPLTDIHLKSKLDYEIQPNSNDLYIYILSFVAFFVLVIAAINFMNLSTAASASRAKEIGIKKVMGASRSQTIRQFLGEAVILSFIALIFALVIVELSCPYLESIINKDIYTQVRFRPSTILFLLLLSLVTGLLSGIYPAVYLSSFVPIKVLKGKLVKGSSGGNARKILVIFQFTISAALITCTLVAASQLNLMRSADLGFNKKNVLLIPVTRSPVVQKYEAFVELIKQSPLVINASSCDYIPGVAHNTHEFKPDGFPEDKWQFYPAVIVRYDYIETMDIEIVAGRAFSRDFHTDPAQGVVINETMVKHMGWTNENAIGRRFYSLSENDRVIGVMKDFHATSLHSPIMPFVFNMKEPQWQIDFFTNYVILKYADGKEEEVIKFLKSVWDKFCINRPFNYLFLEDELNNLYKNEDKLSTISGIFTMLAIFIAALGLVGLSSYLIARRTKEIGIRKVLGASLWSIIRVLSKEFLILVGIANILAWLISYFTMNIWLENFANRVNFSPLPYIISAVVTLSLAFLVIIVKTHRSVNNEPIRALRYE